GELKLHNSSVSLETTVIQNADLTITKTHRGNFVKGQVRRYTLTVSNVGDGPTDAEVIVTDLLPEGLTAVKMEGTGWTCDVTDPMAPFCTRPGTGADALAPGSNYPPITLHAEAAKNAPSEVVNEARISGGGQQNLLNDTASDLTRIVPPTEKPPAYVTITAPTTLTREATITVRGSANPEAVISINGQGITVGAGGNWSTTVVLEEGPNVITAMNSFATDSVTVVRDTVAPVVELRASATETEEPTVELTATSEEGASITIDGKPGDRHRVQLELGPNTFVAEAADPAGNTGTASITVTRVARDPRRHVVQIEPGQSGTATTEVVRVDLPAGAVARTLQLMVQVEDRNSAPRKGAERPAIVAEVNVVLMPEGTPVHNLQRKARITFFYGAAQVADPQSLRIFYYDPEGQAWVELGGVVDPAAHSITVEVDHLTLFAVFEVKATVPVEPGEPVEPPPGKLPFKDVEGHWALPHIARMVERGVVKGYDDNTFRPEAQVSRLEFAVMIARLLGLAPSGEPLAFTDSAGIPDWARGQVSAAVQAGIITGRPDGSFDPNAPVTRAEVAVMLVRALKLRGLDVTPGTAAFTDGLPGWAEAHVLAAARYGLVTGYQDGTFRAESTSTRAEAVTMLARFLDVVSR
ncbi:MAG TPA: S-layer homology domain-containing protein, partial [Symbiobacteriaceae bacterium]|nr:S-layer homology domain-containing protein [Symbiobacteriaceae bacterium]